MIAGAALRYVVRETRGAAARLAFFIACLAVGVAAVVAVDVLSRGLDDGIRKEARSLLAADLAVESREPLPDELAGAIAAAGAVETTRLRETLSVVAAPAASDGSPGPSVLAELKAIDGRYPFYGTLLLDPPRPLDELLADDAIVVAPALLSRLGLEVGDELRVGNGTLRIAGVVLSEPDRVVMSFALAPRVFLTGAALDASGLVDFGSRIEHRLLARLPEGAPRAEFDAAKAAVEAFIGERRGIRVETFVDALPDIRRGLDRVERFVGLVALLSLLVGGVGVAQAIRAWLDSRLDAIAILRCLGVRPRAVWALYLLEAGLLGLAGSVIGAVAGALLVLAVPALAGDIVRQDLLDPWQPVSIARGIVLGVGVTLLFAMAPLSATMRVPPARVFRHDAEPLPPPLSARLASMLALALGVFAVASAQSRSLLLGAAFTAGIGVVFAALGAASTLVVRAVRRVPSWRVPVWARHGLASLARPGSATLGAVTALGIGVTVVLAMLLVERRIVAQLGSEVPVDAPSLFMVDVQPLQWPELESLLVREGADGVTSVPMVTARLREIDGKPVAEMLSAVNEEEGRRRWALGREQRMTFVDELPADNRILEGELFAREGVDEVSVEVEFARDLGVGIGSTLRFDVQGAPIDLVVTSLREVDWGSFGINFFLVAEPSAFAEAPHVRVAIARVEPHREQALQDAVTSRFPNVTIIQVRDVLERVSSILSRLGLGVRLLGGFAVAAGVAILAGAIATGTVKRRREVALLKTLGFTRAGVAGLLALEYALVGLVAGVVGSVAGTVLAYTVTTRGIQIPWSFEWGAVLAAALGSAALAVVAGLLASVSALSARPAEVLRGQ